MEREIQKLRNWLDAKKQELVILLQANSIREIERITRLVNEIVNWIKKYVVNDKRPDSFLLAGIAQMFDKLFELVQFEKPIIICYSFFFCLLQELEKLINEFEGFEINISVVYLQRQLEQIFVGYVEFDNEE